MFFEKVVIILSFSALLGCASGNCYEKKDRSINKVIDDKAPQVWVYQYNGEIQCSKKSSTIDLKKMSKELLGIKIIRSEEKHDGLMRMTVCGAPKGVTNRYLILRKDVPQALDRGFKVWNFEDSK